MSCTVLALLCFGLLGASVAVNIHYFVRKLLSAISKCSFIWIHFAGDRRTVAEHIGAERGPGWTLSLALFYPSPFPRLSPLPSRGFISFGSEFIKSSIGGFTLRD